MKDIQKTFAMVIGAIFLLIGIIGFFNDPILGIFHVNLLHNIVHLVTGVLFLGAAFGGFARVMNKWFGLVYLLVGIIGLFGVLTFLEVQAGFADADNLLHIVLGIVIAGVGWFAK